MIIFLNLLFVPGNKRMTLELLNTSYTGTDKICNNNLYIEPQLCKENVATKISRERKLRGELP